jgi:hypothetical protein
MINKLLLVAVFTLATFDAVPAHAAHASAASPGFWQVLQGWFHPDPRIIVN